MCGHGIIGVAKIAVEAGWIDGTGDNGRSRLTRERAAPSARLPLHGWIGPRRYGCGERSSLAGTASGHLDIAQASGVLRGGGRRLLCALSGFTTGTSSPPRKRPDPPVATPPVSCGGGTCIGVRLPARRSGAAGWPAAPRMA
ncbi:hypothetical protein [Candidatus Palauibacter sp.]|uniref:hypothetical protein n=1 Tax=Candidatus Palauibacter sp. TaxID=3101350 RepID=UPI003B5A6FC6